MLHVTGLSVFCEGNCIVKDATLHIKAGDKIVLTGKSGIGKTILAKALYEGGDEVVTEITKKDIVLLPQHAEQSFNPLQKIRAHFEDIRLSKGIEKEQFWTEITDYFDLFELPTSCLRYYPYECSGGMLQRIQLILAHCQQPKLLIADEPTAALNEAFISKILSFWEESCAAGMAILVITHQVKRYSEFATQFLKLENQKLITFLEQPMPHVKPLKFQQKGLLCCRLDGIAYRQTGGFWRKRLTQVLKIEQFTCQQGEIVGICGASGSGKTTFLHVLLSQLVFTGEAVRPRIQYVPQSYTDSLPAKWTVAQVIREAQEAADCTKEECISLLEQLQIQPTLLKQKVSTLSGGQCQKLALFRVLLKRPKLLLLDEAFASLDEQTTEAITDILLQFVKRGLTIVAVSHDEAWLRTYATKQYIVERQIVKEHYLEKSHSTNHYVPHANSV
ncbi:ATP-binding cassette domain-containing protein [Solibacillus sp. FSL W8-0372]|uniref:ATP-binding cassette domain-containing protein n=1 Tax=Solibacillus sp. FSL W8-0372 TaxID=2921713 RepID=UPI0030CE7CE7